MKHISQIIKENPKYQEIEVISKLKDYISLMHSDYDGTSIMVDEIKEVELLINKLTTKDN